MLDLYDPSGKDVFEAKYIDAVFDEKSRQFVWRGRLDENNNLVKGGALRSYTSLKYLMLEWNCHTELKTAEQNYLYEGLIATYDIDVAVRKLKDFAERTGLLHDIDTERLSILDDTNKTPFISFYIDEDDLIKSDTDEFVHQQFFEFEQLVQKMGYFVAVLKPASRTEDSGFIKSNYCAIHPKYIVEVTNSIYNPERINGILYHITPTVNWKKIEQKGFIPRNSTANMDQYPDRVYFYTKLPPDDFEAKIRDLVRYRRQQMIETVKEAKRDFFFKKIKKEKLDYLYDHLYDYLDWTVVKVDLNKIADVQFRDLTQYRFFDDPKSPGIFTYENIDPMCLSLYKKIQIPKGTEDDLEYLKN